MLDAATHQRVERYSKNHCVTPGKCGGKRGRATTMTPMHKLREDITSQARRYGIDPYDSGS